MTDPSPAPYDALLVVSFGGPERSADVLPFLRNVTRGRDVPADRLVEVAEHYHRLGGRSPINDQCRALVAAVQADLAAHGLTLPVYWGNRNWHPLLVDTVSEMARDGVRRAGCFVTSAYPSYAGCRQYRENLYDAAAAAGPSAPRLDRLRHYADHPGFVAPFADAVAAALGELPEPPAPRLVFVTHSVPAAMAAASGPRGGAYLGRHRETAQLVVDQVSRLTGVEHAWDLVFCSRSGPPTQPWLEPDVNDQLADLAEQGVAAVVLVPVGFVSDHVEVLWDLDVEARQTADRVGLAMTRAATPGTDRRFVAMVRALLLERAAAERAEPVDRAGFGSAGWDYCPAGCCPNPRGPRPAVAGGD